MIHCGKLFYELDYSRSNKHMWHTYAIDKIASILVADSLPVFRADGLCRYNGPKWPHAVYQ